jgi:SAM-dependent methyltransferase
MIDEAKRRNPGLDAQFVVSKVQEYDFPPEAFDLVLSMACLGNACRAEEMPYMARGMVRSVRPGGRIVLIDAFHRLPALARICRMAPGDVVDLFRKEEAEAVEWTGIHFIPVRLLVARERLARFGALTRAAYAAGEAAMRLAPRALSDYKVIVFEKPR